MAWAVMAMIGVGSAPSSASCARRRRAASRPSMTGIWMSMKMMSNVFALQALTALSPFSARVTFMPMRSIRLLATS